MEVESCQSLDFGEEGTLSTLVRSRRTFVISDPRTHDNSIGEGVERSVLQTLLVELTDSTSDWVASGPYVLPQFTSMTLPPHHPLLFKWQAQGALLALWMLYTSSPPLPVSPTAYR